MSWLPTPARHAVMVAMTLHQQPVPRMRGRRAFVTGGGSGIGLASAVRLAAEGAAVAVADVRTDLATQVAARITAARGRAVAITTDVSDETSTATAVTAAADQLGGLDTIVACAGVLHAAMTHELTLQQWQRVIGINLTGTFLPVREALPHLLDAGGGSIVTIGSIASVVAGGYAASYDASKAGVVALTRAVAVQYADRGVRANCVCPGHVATSLKAHSTDTMAGPVSAPSSGPVNRVQAPMTRRADPAEIAAVVAFLCSEESTFMTGTTVMVDGGYTTV
jgi:NAD(P)-dependent dehydrogenase (short-subunit alcohol dehydrogenase family)